MIELRYVQEKDLEKCRELRNENRQWFFDDGIVNEARHLAWFRSAQSDPNIIFYVIELDGAVIGTISTTRSRSVTEIGNLTLDKAHRGKGYMTEAARKAMRPDTLYIGRTLPHNTSSQKVFERLGFKRLEELEDGQVVFKLYN